MIFVVLSACLAIYFMIGMVVVLLFSLSSENFWETTSPKDWIKGILLWPLLVCGFIVGIIERHKEK